MGVFACARRRVCAHPPAHASRFLRKVRDQASSGVANGPGASYFGSRRGTKPQRARPPRCEAAPPKRKGLRAGPSGFLKVAWDRVYFCLCAGCVRTCAGVASGSFARPMCVASPASRRVRPASKPALPRQYTGGAVHPWGRQASTWSAREDGGESRSRAASLNTRENHKCGLSRVRPRCLANTRRVRSRAPLACGGEGRDQKAGSPGTVRLCQAREI